MLIPPLHAAALAAVAASVHEGSLPVDPAASFGNLLACCQSRGHPALAESSMRQGLLPVPDTTDMPGQKALEEALGWLGTPIVVASVASSVHAPLPASQSALGESTVAASVAHAALFHPSEMLPSASVTPNAATPDGTDLADSLIAVPEQREGADQPSVPLGAHQTVRRKLPEAGLSTLGGERAGHGDATAPESAVSPLRTRPEEHRDFAAKPPAPPDTITVKQGPVRPADAPNVPSKSAPETRPQSASPPDRHGARAIHGGHDTAFRLLAERGQDDEQAAPLPHAAESGAPHLAHRRAGAEDDPMPSGAISQIPDPVPPERVPAVIVKWARQLPAGEHRISLRLYPAHLGEVAIQLAVLPDGRVDVALQAANPTTQALLQSHSHQLAASFAESGMSLGRFDTPERGSQRRRDEAEVSLPRRPGSSKRSRAIFLHRTTLSAYGPAWRY